MMSFLDGMQMGTKNLTEPAILFVGHHIIDGIYMLGRDMPNYKTHAKKFICISNNDPMKAIFYSKRHDREEDKRWVKDFDET